MTPSVKDQPTFHVVHDAMAVTGECPLWDQPRETLWWIDIQGQRLLAYRPSTDAGQGFPLPSMPGLVALASSGDLVLGLEDGLWRYCPETGANERLSPVTEDRKTFRLNDGKADRDGRLWFGTMNTMSSGVADGALHCRSVDGRIATVLREITTPNAITLSPDGRTLYFADSAARRVMAVDLDRATGRLSRHRTLIDYQAPEIPDGACVDVDGAIWIAVVNGSRIDRVLPGEGLERSIAVPVTRPTMPMLGGFDGRTLFVTSQRRFLTIDQLHQQPAAGSLLAARTDFTGVATRLVRGTEPSGL